MQRYQRILLGIIFGWTALLFSMCGYADNGTPTWTTAQLYYPAQDTIMGNPHGRVTVVEFFDYRCPYCREVQPALAELVRTNHQVRLVFRDYPLLGPSSGFAAQVALASGLQGKYFPVHYALFNLESPIDQSSIVGAARSSGVNIAQMMQDMTSAQVSSQLQSNAAWAQNLSFQGVPTFVIAATPRPNYQGRILGTVITSPTLGELQAIIRRTIS